MKSSQKPKYIFFGTPKFAAMILEKLIQSGFSPTHVVSNPDRPSGRKKMLTPPPAKVAAEKSGIPVLQPERLNPAEFEKLGAFDFFIVAAYSKIIKKGVIEIPRLGVIGVHPSLLPKHRGASPIQSSIVEGDAETGVTLFLIDERVDHGPILAQERYAIYDTRYAYIDLEKRLAELAGKMLIEALPEFISGRITPRIQDETEATYTKKFSSDDARIESDDLERALSGGDPGLAEVIDRKISAFNPEPGAWTIRNGKRTKLLEAEITGGGRLKLKKIQPEGKKPQSLT